MSNDEIQAMVMKFVDEPWNKGNVDVIDELCAPEYTVSYEPEGRLGGREDLKQAVLDSRKKSPDFNAAVIEIIIQGDRVAYEWTMSRTEEGKFKKSFGITFLRLKAGKIVEDRFIANDVKEGEAAA